MKEPAIVFKDFSFQYKVQHEPTLHDINLTIYKGEKVLILGSSGSGKSTLANCINGLIPFSHHGTMTGSVTVMGQETRESSIYGLSKTVGTVLQDSDAQFVGLSVAEDIAFAMENEAKPRREMVPIVEEHAATVGRTQGADCQGVGSGNLSVGFYAGGCHEPLSLRILSGSEQMPLHTAADRKISRKSIGTAIGPY